MGPKEVAANLCGEPIVSMVNFDVLVAKRFVEVRRDRTASLGLKVLDPHFFGIVIDDNKGIKIFAGWRTPQLGKVKHKPLKGTRGPNGTQGVLRVLAGIARAT